jgi:hypothetical protein
LKERKEIVKKVFDSNNNNNTTNIVTLSLSS